MPAKLHRALEAQARKSKAPIRDKDAYVYGTMKKIEKARKAKRRG